jgi:hypothetical protein
VLPVPRPVIRRRPAQAQWAQTPTGLVIPAGAARELEADAARAKIGTEPERPAVPGIGNRRARRRAAKAARRRNR